MRDFFPNTRSIQYSWSRNIKRSIACSSSEWNGHEIKHILGNSHSTGPTRRREVFERSIRNTFTIKKMMFLVIPHSFTLNNFRRWTKWIFTHNKYKCRQEEQRFLTAKEDNAPVFYNEWHYTWSLIWTGYGGFLKTLSVRFRCIMTWINAKLKKNGLDRLETACNPSFRILRAKQRK